MHYNQHGAMYALSSPARVEKGHLGLLEATPSKFWVLHSFPSWPRIRKAWEALAVMAGPIPKVGNLHARSGHDEQCQ